MVLTHCYKAVLYKNSLLSSQLGLLFSICSLHSSFESYGIDYKVKTELPYNPPQAMLLHAGRGLMEPIAVFTS
jgi:hypothetical protein